MQNRYIHQLEDWPSFRWNWDNVGLHLSSVRHRQGYFLGRVESLEPRAVRELTVESLAKTIVSSSRIEGRSLDADEVRSSVGEHLGINRGEGVSQTRAAHGPVLMMIDATVNHDQPITLERLLDWHRDLFRNEDGFAEADTGSWRDDGFGQAQLLRGPVRRWREGYEPPPAAYLDAEMRAFIDWFEGQGDADPIIRAAVAHLWFMTLCPFVAGSGQIATALTEMALARADGTSERCYNISGARAEKSNDVLSCPAIFADWRA